MNCECARKTLCNLAVAVDRARPPNAARYDCTAQWEKEEEDMIDNSSNVMRGKAVKRSETTALDNSLSARLCQFRIKLG